VGLVGFLDGVRRSGVGGAGDGVGWFEEEEEVWFVVGMDDGKGRGKVVLE